MRNLLPYVVSKLATAKETRKFIFSEETVICCFATSDSASLVQWSPAKGWSNIEFPLPYVIDDEDPLTSNASNAAKHYGIIGLHHDSLEEKSLVVLKNGDFIEARNGVATVVGSLETGVVACEWSPAGELACLVTEEGKVMFINTDFELGDVVMGEHVMTAEDLKLADKHVSVGWGKRETQFKGRGARATERAAQQSADPTVNLNIESRSPVEGDETTVEVSWRGDGEFVVVNSCIGGERALRVFSNDGKLDSVSEPAQKLRGLLSYEPRGALIATISNAEIQFFERNGLKRYSFSVENASDITQLAWSADSSVLAVVYSKGQIDLWTQKNWHWYRKQSLHGFHVQSVVWHPEKPRTMGILGVDSVSTDTWLQFHTFEFTVSSDEGLVAVIDTNEVKVTPLFRAGIPPPMAFASKKLDSQPLAVAVKAPSTVAVSLASGVIEVLSLNLDTAELTTVKTVDVFARRIAFGEHGLVIEPETSRKLVDESLATVLAEPLAEVSVLKGSHYLLGSRLYNFDGQQIADFGEPCTDFVATQFECFGLTRSGKLVHSSGKVVAHGVTSILSTATHLLFTTITTLSFLHLNSSSGANVNFDISGEQRREIERGSLLVTIMSEQMAVVLQAPRGNIETIYPRMLVLGVVRKDVANKEYHAAFTACKIHRIDMNLLYDLDPHQFETNLELFVSQLKSSANLDLFLSSLSDENVAQTKYKDTSKLSSLNDSAAAAEEPKLIKEGKANSILRMLKPYLPPQNSITALAMMKPPALVEALQEAASSPELIKHLVFLTEANDLYRTALSSYEPRLALAVAQQAQMDPKEYLPFLRSLMTEKSIHRAKFNIDVFLKRHERAVLHLIADSQAVKTNDANRDGGDEDNKTAAIEEEIAEFAIRHELHDLALHELQGSARASERLLLESRAQIYLSQSQYVKAGLDFEMLKESERAINAYVQGCAWRKALSLVTPDQVTEVAQRLVETADANKKYGDCAHLLLHYLHNTKQALHYYCQANQFDDAVLVAHSANLDEELESLLRESFGSFQELIADCKGQVPAQLKRLRQIREKRLQDSLGFERMAEKMDELDVADTLSLAGTDATTATGASAYTRYTDKSGARTVGTNATRRTLKNQRRQERKKARGKKGSVYEEDYLIASTTRLIDRLKATRPDLLELIGALIRSRQFFYATQLTTEYNSVLDILAENVGEIYTVDDEALIRFDESGHEYVAERPVVPSLPERI